MPEKLTIGFEADDLDTTRKTDAWDLYIGVTGRLKIIFNDKIFLEEEYSNVVEFAVLLARWLRNRTREFVYKPLEMDDVLLELKYQDGGMMLCSDFSEVSPCGPIPFRIVLEGAEEYINRVSEFIGKAGYDFSALVSDDRLDSRA
ncbi:hypothetical protein [Alcanivorax sp. 1008]|uniref:DUF7878 domain-containing protein n=1 Tax=Alcanivorax sp. 1008 TaxID=2816853 RepID=UPI001D536B1A|nr:hypothetical protein [Alcanivorax sp. 1008]MCC1497712.1 hypothetical protein [Alcanivorax sp. 1008]